MAKPLLIANWKNYPGSLFEAKSLLREIAKASKLFKKWDFYIAPPFTYFESVSGKVNLATQDIEIFSGTRTGSISTDILKSFGVKIAIIGHSERRRVGESDEMINKKIRAALKSGITPLVCVGEETRDHDGEHFEALRNSLSQSLAGLNKVGNISKLIIAYEPVWAIGKSAKEAITTQELGETVVFIKKVLSDILGRKTASKIPVIYGGSVEASNALTLIRGTGIKGFLVGHASLKADSFKAIASSILNSSKDE